MIARKMEKRLRVIEDRSASPEYRDVQIVAAGPETYVMIAEQGKTNLCRKQSAQVYAFCRRGNKIAKFVVGLNLSANTHTFLNVFGQVA